MIVGDFDPSGRPIVEGHLTLPRFGIFRTVAFLVDTGADSTCIHPRDGTPARIPFDLLGGSVPSSGVGGTVPYFRELAFLEFLDVEAREIHKYEVDVFIAKPDPDPKHSVNWLHSLLGRDVIDRWRMVYERDDNLLEFIVRRY